MKGSLKIGSVHGIPIRLHWSLLLLIVIAVGPGRAMSAVLSEAAWIATVFACVLVHELAHSLFARHRGYKVRAVVLMPLGGFSEIFGMADSPTDEALISLIGPITNLVIAGLLAIVGALSEMQLWPPTLFARAWLVRIIWVNLALGGLNLLPALPLDGGRVLRGLLGRTRGRARATAIAARIGTTVATLMIVGGVLIDIWLALIGVFVFFGARAEQQMARAGELLRGVKVGDVMIEEAWGLDAAIAIEEAASLLHRFPGRSFAVVAKDRLIGIITEGDLPARGAGPAVIDVTDVEAPRLRPGDDLYPAAFDAFAQSGRSCLAVERDGHPVGMLYLADVERRLEELRGGVRN